MSLILCELKKAQKHVFHFFCKLTSHDLDILQDKKAQKHEFVLCKLKNLKNMNLIFCKLKKAQKT